MGYDTSGPVAKVTEVLGNDRLRVGQDNGLQSIVLQRSAEVAKATIKTGDDVRVDGNYKMALEVLAKPQAKDHYLDDVPELPWEKVGGQHEALQAIKDAIELPLVHADLFQKFNHTTPKGFLALRPAGLRQDVDRQGLRLQSYRQAQGENRREHEGILHAHQRPGDSQHVGR